MRKIIVGALMIFLLSAEVGSGLAQSETGVTTTKQSFGYVGQGAKQKKQQDVKNKLGMCQKVVVAVYPTNPPFSWVTTENEGSQGIVYKSDGFNLALFQKLFSDLGGSVKINSYETYQEALGALLMGYVDVIAGAYYDTSLIKKGGVYIMPGFFKNPIVAATLTEKNISIKDKKDLIKLKGVVRNDEGFYPYIYQALPKNINVKRVPDSTEAFQLLLTGQADYILGSAYAIETEARRFKLEEKLSYSEKTIADQELFFLTSGASKCNRVLRRALEQKIRETMDHKKSLEDKLLFYVNDWGMRYKDEDYFNQFGVVIHGAAETPVAQVSEGDVSDVPVVKANESVDNSGEKSDPPIISEQTQKKASSKKRNRVKK